MEYYSKWHIRVRGCVTVGNIIIDGLARKPTGKQRPGQVRLA
jgi:hypothetical protein